MKALKKILQRNVIGRFCFVLGLFCLLPIAAEAQMTVKERALRNRNRPALWFLSKPAGQRRDTNDHKGTSLAQPQPTCFEVYTEFLGLQHL